MCRPVKCKQCNGVTWAGCGMHVDQVMKGVPKDARCTCDPNAPKPNFVARLFGLSK